MREECPEVWFLFNSLFPVERGKLPGENAFGTRIAFLRFHIGMPIIKSRGRKLGMMGKEKHGLFFCVEKGMRLGKIRLLRRMIPHYLRRGMCI